MTAFHLKLIAMITMTTDHIAIVFVENNMIMRSIGRIAVCGYQLFRKTEFQAGRCPVDFCFLPVCQARA